MVSLPSINPDRVNFARRQVPPPAANYLGADDLLAVQTLCSHATTTVEIHGRILRPSGDVLPLRYVHTPNRDRSVKVEFFTIGEGFLLSWVVFPTSLDVRRGQLFATLAVTRGGTVSTTLMQVLAQDYLSSSEAMGWPGSPVHSSIEGVGNLRAITPTTPAAGAEISETVPTNARWRVIGFTFNLITSAVAGNRVVRLNIDDGTNVQVIVGNSAAQTAGLAARYNIASFGNWLGLVANHYSLPLPPNLWIPQGWRLRTATSGIDAGDTMIQPQLYVEEWLEE